MHQTDWHPRGLKGCIKMKDGGGLNSEGKRRKEETENWEEIF
jgi:hypothetical protein